MRLTLTIAALLIGACDSPGGQAPGRVTELTLVSKGDVGPGSATVDCRLNPDGALSDCEVLAEDPKGAGLGAAALAFAAKGKLAPQTKSGRSLLNDHIHVEVQFVRQADQPVPEAQGSRRE